jgi:hypothetical protein
VFTGWTHTASAALIQDLFLFDGDVNGAEPMFNFQVTFPEEAGCVDSADFEFIPTCAELGGGFPEFDASSVSVGPLSNGDVPILSLIFMGGFWEINDDWFLEVFVGLFGAPIGTDGEFAPAILVGAVGGQIITLAPEFFPFPGEDDQFGSIGSYTALFGLGGVVAIPSHDVPVPATLLLVGLGLFGLGWSRRKR